MPKISLVENLKVQARPEHIRRLRVIDDEDYSGVIRKTQEILTAAGKSPTREFLERGVEALKLYYAIPVLDPANAHAISFELDPFWHSHMLHSKLYTRFCQEAIGEYLHHEPLDKTDAVHLAGAARLYAYTVEVLNEAFKYVDSYFWSPEVTNARLICFHMRVNNPPIKEIALFKEVERGLPVTV